MRADNEEGAISEGSLFKIKVKDTDIQIQLQDKNPKKLSVPGSITMKAGLPPLDTFTSLDRLQKEEMAKDDYNKSFKLMIPSEQQQSILLTLSDLARFIRTFDMETAKRQGDYTGDALLRILSKALKRLKLLCINALPATIQQLYPYKEPIESLQRVLF